MCWSRLLWTTVVAFSLFASLPAQATAQDNELDMALLPDFPMQAQAWINSPPIAMEQLRGKGVFLYFFDRNAAPAKTLWTTILPLAKRYEKEPVIFVGICSGVARPEVERFAKTNNIPWPLLVDQDRSFEKACDIYPVSGQFPIQLRVITAGGVLEKVSAEEDELEDSLKKAAEGASWKVSPDEVPDALKPVWQAVEFGNYQQAHLALKKAAAKPDLKEAAEKLQAVITQELDELVATAEAAAAGEKSWMAYETVQEISERFRGMPIPDSINKLKKDLAKDPAVKEGMAASKSLVTIRRQMAVANPNLRKKLSAQLEKIMTATGGSKLSKEAKILYDQLQAQETGSTLSP